MSEIILCVDSGNKLLRETAAYLDRQGYQVYVLKNMNENDTAEMIDFIENQYHKLDCLLLSASETIPEDDVIGEGHDDGQLLAELDSQINGTRKVIEAVLPLLRKSEKKRIGMITKAESSVSLCRKDRNYGQYMAWAGLNMVGKIYFNLLRPEGFTFRWYCEREDEKEKGGMPPGEYLMTGLCYDANEPYIHSDENRLVMRDSYLREIPW